MRMKLTQKVDHFTVFNSFSSTCGCSQKFPPKISKNSGGVGGGGCEGDFFIGGGGGGGRGAKRLQLKLAVGY